MSRDHHRDTAFCVKYPSCLSIDNVPGMHSAWSCVHTSANIVDHIVNVTLHTHSQPHPHPHA